MIHKDYILSRTKGQVAKKNKLRLAESSYTASNDLLYDFSLLDEIIFEDDDRELIEKDLMEHHSVSWYSQPMPTIILSGRFVEYIGQIRTEPYRIYKADGKRVCVVIEVTKIHIEKRTRSDAWSEYELRRTYEAQNEHTGMDYEVPAA